MALLRWLDTTQSDAFATEIAEEFAHIFPAAGKGTDVERARKLAHATEVIGNRAVKFHRQHPLGWYRKARFASALKDCLSAKGHDQGTVDGVVYKILLRIGR